MFTFDQLKSFVVLAQELHFGHAAEVLNMTQPPLSRQIQKLEAELGFLLFDRTKKSVSLTQAGVAFRDEAEKILRISESSRELARKIAEGSAGELRLGITATAIMGLLGEILELLDDRAPGISVDVQEMVSQDQMDAVLRGAIDVAFLRELSDSPELDSLLVLSEPLLVAIGSRHPLAVTSRSVSVTDLEGEQVLTYSPDQAHYFNALVESVLNGVTVRPSQEMTQVHSMLALVAANRGIALVPASAAKMGMSGIVFRPIAERGDSSVQLYAVWRRDNFNPVMRAALGVLRDLHARSVQ
ncbi:LysR family transcriptional regulator [Salinibacterium hongtaonis]|uniref:LysR family transcriptional regulator n=1 Tax=Homoserinimonas hongtaonis TaxID=2079791 RepID=UPI001304A1D3|nr:LysR family transcriptional regulator [Salinibacterium hongtaonis]